MKKQLFLAFCLGLALQMKAQPVSFRGDNHCGKYPDEKGLLKQWPAEGPEKLWVVTDCGKSNSTAQVYKDRIYTAGLTPDEQNEQITCYTLDGKKVYQVTYGRAWTKSYQETRCTPVIDGDYIYIVSGMGELVCLARQDGRKLWSFDYWNKYDLHPNDQGICEHPLIDGNKVIVTSAGKTVCMTALNKKTGEILWETPSLGDNATYMCSRMVEWKGKRQIIGGTELHVFGVDPESGKMIWNDDSWGAPLEGKRWMNALINCPVFYEGYLYVGLGDGHGGTMYRMADDLSGVERLWRKKEVDPYMGGMVEVDGVIYASTGSKHQWVAFDIKSGEVYYQSAWPGGKGRGSLIEADGMFYMFDERRGYLGLANINKEKLDIVSEVRVTDGSGAFFAHPSIFNGVLYLRHGEALIAYKVK